MVDVLSQLSTCLDLDTVRSILDRIGMGSAHWAKVHDPTVVEGDHHLEQEVHVTAGHVLVQIHVTDLTELVELHNSSGNPIPMLNVQRQD